MGNYHKKGKGKLPLFGGNVERVIPIYARIYIKQHYLVDEPLTIIVPVGFPFLISKVLLAS